MLDLDDNFYLISIGNRMNTSAFCALWAWVMFWKFSKLHEPYEQVHTIFYLLYSRQNYSIALLCTPYVLQKTLQWVPKCSHVLFEPIKNVMLWQVNQAWSSWKFLRKYYKPNCQPFFYNLVFKFGASPVFPWQLLRIALYNLYCTL